MPEPKCPFCGSPHLEDRVLLPNGNMQSDGKLHCIECKRAFPHNQPTYPDPAKEQK